MKSRVKSVVTAALVAVAIAGGLWLQAEGRASSAQALGPTVTGCVIRLDPQDGAYIHDNTAHHCTGAMSVTVEPDGDLLIVHSAWRGAIITMSAEEDESISESARCGPSGGTISTTVRCWDLAGNRISVLDPRVTCDLCNIWLHWVHEGSG